MKSFFENGTAWLWNHKPDVAIAGALVAGAIWITSAVNSAQSRLATTERLCNDMNERQLPEIREQIREVRGEIKETRDEMKQMKEEITEIKQDVIEIKLFMKKIDTYLSSTDKKYPR